MRKNLLPIFFFVFLCQISRAQQLPLFTQYSEYQGLLNPSAVLNDYFLYEYNLTMGMSVREQWIGVPGSPQTQAIRGEYMVNTGQAFNFLFGGYLMNHTTGPISFTGIYGRVAGLMTDYDPVFGGLSIGISGGLIQYRVDVEELRRLYPDDILTYQSQTKFFPDVGVGATYYRRMQEGWFKDDNIYIGISAPQVLGLNLQFRDDNGEFNIKRVPHYYGFLSYYKYISSVSYLEFSTWGKFVPSAPTNFDFNIRYQINHLLWIGAGASTAGIGHFEFGLLFDDLLAGWDNRVKVAYAYDPSFTTYGARFGNSHELNISLALDTASKW